jgi:RNA polymerase sigma-70 factor (ECF subfamily)
MQFEDIYRTFSPKVYRLCMGYVNNTDWAKDLVQETFISVWQNLPKFRNESSVDTWIFRIATNNCLRQLEKENRHPKTELPVQLEEKIEVRKDDKIDFLYKCISELEETERIIISLVLEDLPQAEIAGIVGLTEGNLRVKIHRIKEKLTAKFVKYGQLQ